MVQREIDLGQTVAASLNAPTLFTIAQDLREIDIWANIDEADVGRMKEGQSVSFTVNAYPEPDLRGPRAHGPPRRADDPERRHLYDDRAGA